MKRNKKWGINILIKQPELKKIRLKQRE